jgi:gas vesicle protein
MKRTLALLTGLGVGAALMYLFDPERGNKRRALIRDKAAKLNRQTTEAIQGRTKDLSNRARGMAHELKSAIIPEQESSSEPTANWSDGPAV